MSTESVPAGDRPIYRRRPRRMSTVLVFAGLACFGPAITADAYNHDQHQGVVDLGYKAMVAAVMEKGCFPSFSFALANPTASLRAVPTAFCDGDLGACQTRWTTFLTEFERAIRYLRSVDSSLAAPRPNCPDPRGEVNTLGEVGAGVNRFYNREPGVERDYCGVPVATANGCSMPLGLCDEGSVYQYLDPGDHTGDVLGYWATAPDDDDTNARLGVKPTSAAGLGKTIDTVNDGLELGVAALAAPFACAWHFLSEGDLDCLDDAKQLADAAIPLEDLSSIVPVIGEIKSADAFSGLWHFQNMNDGVGVSNECDDRQGILYEEAGPHRIPDALDVAFVVVGDALGLTLNFDASTGPKYFNITDPGDGDQPSCDRDRADWEFQTFGHTAFSPIDNLGLYGWKRFTTNGRAEELGWPLHALGDAVAPHHAAATTGWGHRPFEDAAELHWRSILYLDKPTLNDERIRLQYEQLRRILAWGFHYAQALDRMRAERPTGQLQNEIPVRALVTQVTAETLAETTEPGTGAPRWPFDPTLSVPYVLDAAVKTQYLTAIYGTVPAIDGTRALLERGAGAVVAFLSSVWRIQGETVLPAFSPCDPQHDGSFIECGPVGYCSYDNYPNVPPYGCCAVSND